MPWVKKLPIPPPPHRCSRPDPSEVARLFGAGSVWKCDDCGKRWVFRGLQFREPYRRYGPWGAFTAWWKDTVLPFAEGYLG